MPKQSEICVVEALGRKYDIWETVECTHATGEQNTFDHCMLTVAENSTGAKSISDLKLKPGDQATVTLAGRKIMDGMVYLRQAAYDANTHAVQIGICSAGVGSTVSTVDVKPGQYLNQTVQQIGSACLGVIGLNFQVLQAVGADLPFDRVSEHLGETRFSFVERLCRMRNLHLADDGNNGIIAFRGPNGSSGLMLKEGFNILRARLLLKNNESASNVDITGDYHGQDTADENRSSEGHATQDTTVNRPIKLPAEHTGTDQEMQMRADKEVAYLVYQTVDGDITVPGWLVPGGGSLWWDHLRETVTVDSPMLIPPQTSNEFFIKGITHSQNSVEGTTTTISITDRNAFGARADLT